MTTAIELLRNPRLVADDLDHCFGSGQDACLQWDTAETNDALKLGLNLNDAAFSGNFILVNKDHIDKDTGLGVTADPRLVVWSGDDPVAGGANEYVSLLHNRTDAVIESGAGAIQLNPATDLIIGGNQAIKTSAGDLTLDPADVVRITGSPAVIRPTSNVALQLMPTSGIYGAEVSAGGHFVPTTNNGLDLGISSRNWRIFWCAGPLNLGHIGTLGRLQLGAATTHATTIGHNLISIFNATAPVGTLTNGASFYVSSGEMQVIDSGGVVTQLSPHDPETGEWWFNSKNTVTGRVFRVHMERLMRRLDEMFGGGFIEEFIEGAAI